ncbi:MAG: isoaspartyl peptidase, partial [Coleofasciculus sp. C2-GNP5-27]
AIAWGKTSQILLAAYHTGHHKGDTLEMIEEVQTV